MPSVRVVIPTYNRAELLKQALASALEQEFRDLEVMVVDDGSTDGTPDLLNETVHRDARVRFIRTNRVGPARARNTGIAQPGEFLYVAFLDSDDLWLPHHLTRAIAVLGRTTEAAAVFARIQTDARAAHWTPERLADREARVLRPLLYSIRTDGDAHLMAPSLFRRALVRGELQPHPSTSVIRASAVIGKWFDTSFEIFEDTEFFLRLAQTGSFAFVNAIHARVRYQGDNLTGGVADLRRPENLSRCSSTLRYAKWRLPLCEEREDRATVRRQVADSAYLVGQCWAERGQLANARRAYFEALAYEVTYPALKGLLASLLPGPIFRGLRRLKYWAAS